ncbi:MAG: ABC transporter permease [Chloroflexota bacterium]
MSVTTRSLPTRGRAQTLLSEYGLSALLSVSMLAVWQIGVGIAGVPKWLLPSPLDVVATIATDRDLIGLHVGRTIQEAALGFVLAGVLGISLGFMMDAWPLARRVLYPPMIASQTVPIIAIAPLLVIWFGYDITPKVMVVALICFFPMVVSTIDGLANIDPDYANLVRAMGGNERSVLRRVRIPGALPSIFSGARIAVTYSVIGAVVGEWVGASRGLGIYMVRAADQMLTERVFAAIVLCAALSIGFFLLIAGIEHLVIPWRRSERRT